MPKFKKGQGGRKHGSVGRATKTNREAITYALEHTRDDLVKWLVACGKRSPKKAIDAWVALAEFVMPKLQRTEHVGENPNPVTFTVLTNNENTLINLESVTKRVQDTMVIKNLPEP